MPDDLQSPDVHEVTLHLAPINKLMKWWCINCRNLLFFSHDELIMIDIDGSPAPQYRTPKTIICAKCRWQYNLQDII